MLQDPRPIKTLQQALQEVLEHLGIEFLPRQWLDQQALLDPEQNTELAHLKAYLLACNIQFQFFEHVQAAEIQHLDSLALVMTAQGQAGLLRDHQGKLPHAGPLAWAIQLKTGRSEADKLGKQPAGLMEFWKKLRNSEWLKDAFSFEKGSFKPVVYASLLINILALAGPLFSLQVYDRIIPNQAYASLAALFLGVALCLGFEHVLKHARHKLMEIAATSIDTRCTARLSKGLLNVPMHRTEPTVLLQHIRSFEQLRELITGVFLLALIDLPFLVLFLLVIGLIQPVFLLVSGGVILLTLVLVVSSHRQMSRLGQQQMVQARETQSQWLDSLACLDNIQATGVQQAHTKLLNTLQLKSRMAGNSVRELLFLVNQRIHLLQQGSWVATIALGVFFIVEKQLTVGGLIAVSMLTMRCFAPIQKLQAHLLQTHSAQASFEELDQFLSQQENSQNGKAALESIEHVSVENASVLKPGVQLAAQAGQLPHSTRNADHILKGVNLVLPAGSRVGIIGHTGSGKTSVLKLLARQLNCDSGHVAVNHLAVDHYHPTEFNSRVGYATQPPVLIKGTLLDNIRFMRTGISTASCWAIIQQLGLKQWVEQHPDGLHMKIESQGNNLSSGQKQALSLCRALVGQPQLILLDEPTVCLDQHMENCLSAYLQNLPANTTLLFTTHKLGLLACANSLVLMNNGEIHSQGAKAQVLHAANSLAKGKE